MFSVTGNFSIVIGCLSKTYLNSTAAIGLDVEFNFREALWPVLCRRLDRVVPSGLKSQLPESITYLVKSWVWLLKRPGCPQQCDFSEP